MKHVLPKTDSSGVPECTRYSTALRFLLRGHVDAWLVEKPAFPSTGQARRGAEGLPTNKHSLNKYLLGPQALVLGGGLRSLTWNKARSVRGLGGPWA